MEMSRLWVMIVDSRVAMRRKLSDLISRSLVEMEVMAATPSLETAVSRLEISPVDFLIIESALYDRNKIESVLMKWKDLTIIVAASPEQEITSIDREKSQGRVVFLSISPQADDEGLNHHFINHLKTLLSKCNATVINQKLSGVTVHDHLFQRNGVDEGIIVVAVSTGGPNALAELIPAIDARIKQPILIVQHIPDEFVEPLAQRLNGASRLDVSVATEGEVLRSGICRIAPGRFHLEVARNRNEIITRFSDSPPENACKPAADVLFRSAAGIFGSKTIGVVLTGMGRDGCQGSEMIVRAGGRIIVQDQQTSVVWGMPGSVVEAGLTEKILPLHKIADELNRLCVAKP
jgi:two-component system chemotaxis response regulator CheB